MLFTQVFGSSASAVLMVDLKSSEPSLVLSATDFKAETISITSFVVVVVFFTFSYNQKKKIKIYALETKRLFFLQCATFSSHLVEAVF